MMSAFDKHRDPHSSLSFQARMSLLSWGKGAEGVNGAQDGHKGKFGAGKGGVCDFWGQYDHRAPWCQSNEAMQA